MRRNTYSKILANVIAISAFFIFLNIFSISVSAEQLNIHSKTAVFEGEEFTVSVYIETESEYTYLEDVSVGFDNIEYEITEASENSEVILVAPQVDEDQTYYISATKTGYESALIEITVRDKSKLVLEIIPENHIIDEGEEFYVTIVESVSQEPIENAKVYISNQGGINRTTNSDGIAFLNAPENFEEITINARKDGYSSDSINVKIKSKENPILGIVTDRYFLVFACVIILIFSILFVNFRQKRHVYSRAKEISDQKIVDKYGPEFDHSSDSNKKKLELEGFSGDPVRVKSSEDNKVEEIRISRPNKVKDTVDFKSEEQKIEETPKKTRRPDESDWYKGKDELKYEIDKLTGEVDEEGRDKWFEGVEGLKEKVDKRIKKKKEKEEK